MKSKMLYIYLIIVGVVFTQNIYSQQSRPTIVCGIPVYLGHSFNNVQCLNNDFKWYSSSSDGTETHLLSSQLDVYLTFTSKDYNRSIISQRINYQGSKSVAKKYFLRAIDEVKEYGGYIEILDRNYNGNTCQVFYKDMEITISFLKVENQNIYFTFIELELEQ